MYMIFTDLCSIHTELKVVVGYHTKIGHFHHHIKVIDLFSISLNGHIILLMAKYLSKYLAICPSISHSLPYSAITYVAGENIGELGELTAIRQCITYQYFPPALNIF